MAKVTPDNYRFGGSLRLHILPVFVWLAAVAGVVVLFQHRAARFEVLGMAQGQVRQIAATCTGRLISVPVELFQDVKKGDTVAIIDTVLGNENLEAELATVSAEVQHLMAQLVPAQEQLLAEASDRQSDWIARYRRFSVDVEQARLAILEIKTLIETDRMLLEDWDLEVRVSQELLDKKAVTSYDLQKAKVQYDALAKKIGENEKLLAGAEEDLKQAQLRRDEFAQHQPHYPEVDSALEVIRKAIMVQEKLVEQLLARRKPLILKSPIDGVISQILRRPVRRTGEGIVRQLIRRSGEAVLEGEPILTVADPEPSEIIAWVGREQLGWVHEGMAVELVKSTKPQLIAMSRVTYLGPIMEVIPQRLWQVPDIPQWGRPMLVEIPPGLKLFPGEVVGIKQADS